MKLYSVFFVFFLLATSAFSAGDWRSYSYPFPIRSSITYGSGVLLATDGGIRYRTLENDHVFHSENGLETSSFFALANSALGAVAVSEYGLVAILNKDGQAWRVLNRSFLLNKVHARPDGAVAADSVLAIAFEDRLAFFDVVGETFIVTIDKIAGLSLSVNPVEKMVVRKDSLYVRLGGEYYARQMNWSNLRKDVRMSDPSTWTAVKNPSSVEGLEPLPTKEVRVGQDTLGLDLLFDAEGVSKVKWIWKVDGGYYIIGDEFIYLYNGNPKKKDYADLSFFSAFGLTDTYEIKALPAGGALAASIIGNVSYSDGYGWKDAESPFYGAGSNSSALTGRLKTLSVQPNGRVFFHIWGVGYFMYPRWGDAMDYGFYAGSGLCLDTYGGDLSTDPPNPGFFLSVSTTPAPDGSGFLAAVASEKGYSIAYFTNDGEVHCADRKGESFFGGPIVAKADEDGSWVIYAGSRHGNVIAVDGALDEFRYPNPRNNGGELVRGSLKTYHGLASSLVDMAYDSTAKRLWVISMSTLAYLDEERDTLIPPSSIRGLRGTDFTSLDIDGHGNLWLGTGDQGAFRLSPKGKSVDTLSVEAFNTRNGMLSDDVNDLAVDPVLGAVWFSHSKGVSRYFRKDLKKTISDMAEASSIDVEAYPIPFRPKVHRVFTIDHIDETAVVSIFNRGGALIRSFSKNDVIGGKLEWDGYGKDGNLVVPGVYYYVVQKSSKKKKGKFIVIH